MRTSMTTQTTTEKKKLEKILRLTNQYVKVLQFAPIIIRTLWNRIDWWRRLDQTPPIHIINQITWVSAFVQTADRKAIPFHFRISRWFKLMCVSVLVVVGVRPAFVSDCVCVCVCVADSYLRLYTVHEYSTEKKTRILIKIKNRISFVFSCLFSSCVRSLASCVCSP